MRLKKPYFFIKAIAEYRGELTSQKTINKMGNSPICFDKNKKNSNLSIRMGSEPNRRLIKSSD